MSFSTPTSLKRRMSTVKAAQLSAESGDVPDDTAIQAALDAGYGIIRTELAGVVPASTAITDADDVARLVPVEEALALAELYGVRRDIQIRTVKTEIDVNREWAMNVLARRGSLMKRPTLIDLPEAGVRLVLESWGTPYAWGAGKPSIDGWPIGVPGVGGGVGYDCSGYVQAALVKLGMLKVGTPDRTAAAMWEAAKVIPPDEAQLGDLAFYGSFARITHVMLCLGGGACIGATGGTSLTHGDDPRAFVQLEPITYRNDFRGVRRLP